MIALYNGKYTTKIVKYSKNIYFDFNGILVPESHCNIIFEQGDHCLLINPFQGINNIIVIDRISDATGTTFSYKVVGNESTFITANHLKVDADCY